MQTSLRIWSLDCPLNDWDPGRNSDYNRRNDYCQLSRSDYFKSEFAFGPPVE